LNRFAEELVAQASQIEAQVPAPNLPCSTNKQSIDLNSLTPAFLLASAEDQSRTTRGVWR